MDSPKNIHEHKDITIPLIIHYYLLRAFRTLHKSFHTLKIITSGFFRVNAGVGIIQYVYALNPCVHRFNYSRTLPQRSSPSGLWT